MFDLYYRNTRLLVLTICLILVAGGSSFWILPRLEDPPLTKRVAMVRTIFPGASAERVESLVTEPLEDVLDDIEEIKQVTSTSLAGISSIVIELKDTIYEVDQIWSRVRDKLDDARVDLPPDALKPEFDEAQMSAYAMITALTWQRNDPPNHAVLVRLAEELKDRLQRLRGTDTIDTFGQRDEEIVVEVHSEQLAQLGLSAADVAGQLRASDAKVTAGLFRGAAGNLVMEVDSELLSLERVRSTPIHYGPQGQFVRLADLAEVRKSVIEPPRNLALVDGHAAVTVSALVDPNQRVDHWAIEARKTIDRFASELPRGIEVYTVLDQAKYVTGRLNDLMWNMMLGAFAVMVVTLLMLGWRSALIVGTALPLTALMVCAGMRMLGIPLHQMSVTGLIIALGLLIDNAIVIVDEVQSRIHRGTSPGDAIRGSVKHLIVPLLGSTLTTALAFAPVALMPGPGGEFVGPIAISVILAIWSSYFLAMTVTPSFVGLMRRSGTPVNRWWVRGIGHPSLRALYERSLDFLYARPLVAIGISVLVPVLGFVQARTLREQFFPPTDRDQIQIELELPTHASIAMTRAAAEAARERIMAHENVVNVHWFLGESAPAFYYNLVERKRGTAQYAQGLIQIRSPEGDDELIRELQRELDSAFPEMLVIVRKLEQGPPFDAPVEVRFFGSDLALLREFSAVARTELAAIPGVIHARADLSETLPKLALRVDEEEARLARLDHLTIARQLDATLEGAIGGSMLEATEELPVRVRVDDQQRGNLDHVASIDLVAPAGISPGNRPFVPLSAVADLDLIPEQATIARRRGRRAVTIQAYLAPGLLPSQVLEEFQQRLASTGLELPPGYSLEYGGEAEARDSAVGNLMSSVSILLVLMAATLVLSFGSFRSAAIIALVGVLAIGVGFAALWVFQYPFGFTAIIGTMGLVGVAINDGIVVLAALRADPAARRGDRRQVREVAVEATRHVLTTTTTTIAGFTPLLLAGGDFWPPCVIAIAGGVGGATVLALIMVPAMHLLLSGNTGGARSADGLSMPEILARPEPDMSEATA